MNYVDAEHAPEGRLVAPNPRPRSARTSSPARRGLGGTIDKIDRLDGFTHYTTRMLRNSAMPGSLTPGHKGTVYWRYNIRPGRAR